jgi:uncharacterized protein YcfL
MTKRFYVYTLSVILSSCALMNPYGDKVAKVGNVKDISVTDLRSKRSINGEDLMMAHAVLKNENNDIPQTVYYRCHFYTVDKFDLSKDVQWNTVYIDGGQSKSIECSSGTKDATSFKIELSSSDKASKVY